MLVQFSFTSRVLYKNILGLSAEHDCEVLYSSGYRKSNRKGRHYSADMFCLPYNPFHMMTVLLSTPLRSPLSLRDKCFNLHIYSLNFPANDIAVLFPMHDITMLQTMATWRHNKAYTGIPWEGSAGKQLGWCHQILTISMLQIGWMGFCPRTLSSR